MQGYNNQLTNKFNDCLQPDFSCFEANEDNTKRYVISAFRLYSQLGRPTGKILSDSLYHALYEKNKIICKYVNIQDADDLINENIGKMMLEYKAIIDDVDSVGRTLFIANSKINGVEILKSLEYVYFKDPGKKLKKGDIARRVTQASLKIPASERQIYYWLKEARVIFCKERGLRL